jgi:hypothetical protein
MSTFAGAAFGLTMSLVPLLIGVTLLGMGIADLLLLIPSVVLSALTFAAFGILFSARAQEMSSAMVPMNLIRLPMLFVSGVFAPGRYAGRFAVRLLPDASHLLGRRCATGNTGTSAILDTAGRCGSVDRVPSPVPGRSDKGSAEGYTLDMCVGDMR